MNFVLYVVSEVIDNLSVLIEPRHLKQQELSAQYVVTCRILQEIAHLKRFYS